MANSPDKIRETMEQLQSVSEAELNEIISDGAVCGHCHDCSASDDNHDFSLDCNALVACAAKELIRRLTEGQRSEPVVQTQDDMLPFVKTVQFMRERGHRRCYMCGTVLEGGATDGSHS